MKIFVYIWITLTLTITFKKNFTLLLLKNKWYRFHTDIINPKLTILSKCE
jgi:hypothetical protein